MRYGLIRLTDADTYTAYSEHFHAYLKLIERQVDLWPIWHNTEIALRDFITMKMIEIHGGQWITELEKARVKLKGMFDNCRSAQSREARTFGSRASQNLIDFTYPRDLFNIMFAEWKTFQPVLGKDKGYWNIRAELLTKVRNPLAHSRDVVLNDYERQLAEAYCKEIYALLGGHD